MKPTTLKRPGFFCPECLSDGGSWVLHTHNFGLWIRRIRICRSSRCNHLFTTREFHDAEQPFDDEVPFAIRGVLCPLGCDDGSWVLDTISYGDWIKRQRICQRPTCNHLFSTKEFLVT